MYLAMLKVMLPFLSFWCGEPDRSKKCPKHSLKVVKHLV